MMDSTLDELRTKGDKALMDFLQADLNLGFTFARLARIEKGLDEPASTHAQLNALKVIQTVAHFEIRMNDSEPAQAIRGQLAELERAVSEL